MFLFYFEYAYSLLIVKVSRIPLLTPPYPKRQNPLLT